MIRTYYHKNITSDITNPDLVSLVDEYQHILEMSENDDGTPVELTITDVSTNNAVGVMFITPSGVPGAYQWKIDPTIVEGAFDVETGNASVIISQTYGKIRSDGTVLSQKSLGSASSADQDRIVTDDPASGVWESPETNSYDYRFYWCWEFTKPGPGMPESLSFNVGVSGAYTKLDIYPDPVSESGTLFISGASGDATQINNDITLYMQGKPSGNIDLYIIGGRAPIENQVAEKLYFTSASGVERCDLDGTNRELLLSESHPNGPGDAYGIILDPSGEHVYFSDIDNNNIQRIGLEIPDGETDTDRTDIEIFASGLPSGVSGTVLLDIHLPSGFLVWTSKDIDLLYYANLIIPSGQDYTNRTDIQIVPGEMNDPESIVVDHIEDKIYWSSTSGSRNSVFRKDLFTGANQEEIYFDDTVARIWTIDHASRNGWIYIWETETPIGVAQLFRVNQDGTSFVDLTENPSLTTRRLTDLKLDEIGDYPRPIYAAGSFQGQIYISDENDGETLTNLIAINDPRHLDILYASTIVDNNITFFISGPEQANNNIDLFTHGKDTASGTIDLIIFGPISQSGDIDLFIEGHQTQTGQLDLFILGNDAQINDIDLFIHGFDSNTNNITLFISGPFTQSGQIDLYVNGKDTESETLDLFIQGFDESSDALDLIIVGHEIEQNSITLYANGIDTDSNNIDLIIFGPFQETQSLELFIDGKDTESNSTTLFIEGVNSISANITLFTVGHKTINNNIDLFIHGIDDDNNNLDLIIFGPLQVSGAIDLFIQGHGTESNSIDLFIEGHSIESNSIDLFINGHQLENGNIDLVIFGPFSQSGDIALFIPGIGPISNDLDLFISGPNLSSGTITLFINGHETITNNIDLFIQGSETESGTLNLFIHGQDQQNGDCDLYINGHQNVSGDITLFIKGHDVESNDITLFINGINQNTNNLDLFIKGIDSTSGNIDLTINGHQFISGNIDLFINGKNTASGDITLFVNSVNSSDNNINLFINGFNTDTNNLNLFIDGKASESGNLDIFIEGNQSASGNISLFVPSIDILNNNIALFIDGQAEVIGNIDLFIKGNETDTNNIFMFIHGLQKTLNTVAIDVEKDATIKSSPFDDTKFGLEETSVIGHNTGSGISNRTLMAFDISQIPSDATIIEAHIEALTLIDASGSQEFRSHPATKDWSEIDVTWNERESGIAWDNAGADFASAIFDTWNVDSTSGAIKSDIIVTNVVQNAVSSGLNIANILLKEHVEASIVTELASQQNPSGGPNLIVTYSTTQPNLNLVMPNTFDIESNNISLYIEGFNTSSSDTDLFVSGHELESSGFNLFTDGSGIIPISGSIVLCMNGFVAKSDPTSPVCPALDPTASIQISDELIGIYQSRIDALINQLGKNVILEFPKIKNDCPNCGLDTMRGRSNGIYTPGGPRPFQKGRICPWCKGSGYEITNNLKCIKALTKWNPRDLSDYGIDVSDYEGVVRLKTFLTHLRSLKQAETAIVNNDIAGIVKFKVKLIKGPVKVGLRENRYCISFWQLLDE